jgi:hypothetical protein
MKNQSKRMRRGKETSTTCYEFKKLLSILSDLKSFACDSPSAISNNTTKKLATSVAEMLIVQLVIATVKIVVFLTYRRIY